MSSQTPSHPQHDPSGSQITAGGRRRNRLPDWLEDRRIDTIACALDIDHLVDRLWAALLAGDEQQITRMLARIDDNAARIRQKMCEIKRLNQAVGKTPVQT